MPFLLVALFSALTFFAIDDIDGLEHREKIAIIDTGITITEEIKPYLCGESRDATGTGIEDRHGHGTNIANIIKKGMNKRTQCLLIVKYFNKKQDNADYYTEALYLVLKEKGVKYLNLSVNGYLENPIEKEILETLLHRGVVVSVAAGNNKEFLSVGCKTYPSCYNFEHKNFHVVGNTGVASSNFGPLVRYWENGYMITGGGITMTGTSQACAVHMSKLIRGN